MIQVTLEVVTESEQPLPPGFTVTLTDERSGFVQRADSDKTSVRFRFVMMGLEAGAPLMARIRDPVGREFQTTPFEVPAEVLSESLDLGRWNVSIPDPRPASSLVAGGWIVGADGRSLPDGSGVTLRGPSGQVATGAVRSGRFTLVVMDITGRMTPLAPGDTLTFEATDPTGQPLSLRAASRVLTRTDVTNRSVLARLEVGAPGLIG